MACMREQNTDFKNSNLTRPMKIIIDKIGR